MTKKNTLLDSGAAFEKLSEGIFRKEIEINQASCNRCMFTWYPKVSVPKYCTNCKSPYWNKPRKLFVDARGIVNKYGFDKIEVGEWSVFPTAPMKDGTIDTEANAKFSKALEAYMRRKGYTYTVERTAANVRVMRRS